MDSVRVSRDTISRTDSVRVSVNVTNTGTRVGDAVVQLYIRQDYTSDAADQRAERFPPRVARAGRDEERGDDADTSEARARRHQQA